MSKYRVLLITAPEGHRSGAGFIRQQSPTNVGGGTPRVGPALRQSINQLVTKDTLGNRARPIRANYKMIRSLAEESPTGLIGIEQIERESGDNLE